MIGLLFSSLNNIESNFKRYVSPIISSFSSFLSLEEELPLITSLEMASEEVTNVLSSLVKKELLSTILEALLVDEFEELHAPINKGRIRPNNIFLFINIGSLVTV